MVEHKRIPEGSEGLCPHCEHRYECPMSTVRKMFGLEIHTGCRLGCNGITELYPLYAMIPTYDKDGNMVYENQPKSTVIKHHKFELREEEKERCVMSRS